jgi:hypothetical protein
MTDKSDAKASGTGGEPEIVIEAEPAVPIVAAVPTTSTATSEAAAFTVTCPSSAVPAAPSKLQESPNIAPQSGQVRVPPNAPPGGQWISKKVIGPATWSICTSVSILTCLFTCLPCGVWAFACPCDEKIVYVFQGTAYDEHGRVVGSA